MAISCREGEGTGENSMKNWDDNLVTFIGSLLGLILRPAVGCLLGMASGWIAGAFFSGWILPVLEGAGIETPGLTLTQVGATMGFLCGFLVIRI